MEQPMQEPRQLDINVFDFNPLLREKLIRMRNYLIEHPLTGYDNLGYILENNSIESVYDNASGVYIGFRPAISLYGRNLKLYSVPFKGPRGDHYHEYLEQEEAFVWLYCDNDSYNPSTKRCIFNAFNADTAQYIEEQYLIKKQMYNFSVNGNAHNIYPTNEPELFIQEQANDQSKQRIVLRIPSDEAKDITVMNEIKSKVQDQQALLLLETIFTKDSGLLNSSDIDKFDELSKSGMYTSGNYKTILEQESRFLDLFGILTRTEAYQILSQIHGLETGLIINM